MSVPTRPAIEIPHDEIADFCRRHRVRKLALFGSVLRADFSSASDVDVLVEFEPGTRMGLRFFSLQDELSKILRRQVDLNTEGFLSRYFRDEVLAEAETIAVVTVPAEDLRAIAPDEIAHVRRVA